MLAVSLLAAGWGKESIHALRLPWEPGQLRCAGWREVVGPPRPSLPQTLLGKCPALRLREGPQWSPDSRPSAPLTEGCPPRSLGWPASGASPDLAPGT